MGGVVGRGPVVVVLAVIVLTVVLGWLSGQAQESSGDEGMLPDTPEITAARVVADRFGGDGEGVVQVLRHRDLGDQAPIWAAVGQLQFDVAAWRMEHEFGAPVRLEGTRFDTARATDELGAAELAGMRDVDVYRRESGAPLALFRSRYVAERIARDHPDLMLDTLILG
jgi:hypothetical protein